MKINAFLVTFNDTEYLEQTLHSVQDFADKLYIIEGSWKSAQESSGCSARSDKATFDIINKFVDNKKIFLIEANEHRERDQRQVGLELAKKDGAEWCYMFDSDEVYTRSSLTLLKHYLFNYSSGLVGYRINSYNFINSFNKWYQGNYMRCYRVTPEARFYMDNDCAWPDLENFPELQRVVGQMPGYSFYHYNYVKLNKEAFIRKMKYQNEQDPSFNIRMLPQYGFDEFKKEYKIPSDIKIYDFKGKHPAIMKSHPYFVNNIYNDTNLSFLKE